MELKKYKLGECLLLIRNGAVIQQRKGSSGIPITRIETLSNDRFNRDRLGYADITDLSAYKDYILDDCDLLMSHINSREFLGRTVMYKKQKDENIIHGMNLLRLKVNSQILDPYYAYYFFQTAYFKKFIDSIRKDAINQSSLSISDISKFEITLPPIKKQKEIVESLKLLDQKIALNRQISDNLEAMAKQLYDYWFVQFDFPNDEGKPYKSSGGKMVWNEELQLNIPYKWEICKLNQYISKNNTGDWGNDEASNNSIEIRCIRGADILQLNNLPKRYIKEKNTSKLLSEWDMVIEVSGGSPTQATGRCALITPGSLKRNGKNVTCSNFCHAFSFKNYKNSAYFFYLWKMFYNNDIMFNFEGKTSGIKNFMTETFLANKWIKPEQELLSKFFDLIKDIYARIDINIEEINILTQQRDELLPLLMNGQVSVKEG